MNKQGYTLIEVTLFLAITGVLALVAIVGLAPRLRNVRFTDSVRSLESTSQRQLNDFQGGINLRETGRRCVAAMNVSGYNTVGFQPVANNVGASEECILNGKLAVFKAGQVEYYPIVSHRQLTTTPTIAGFSCSQAGFQRALCYGPTIVDSLADAGIAKTTASYKNGVTNNAPTAAYGHLQDPENGQVYPFVYTSPNLNNNLNYAPILPSQAQSGTNQQACATLSLGGRQAKVTYRANSLVPQATFNEACS